MFAMVFRHEENVETCDDSIGILPKISIRVYLLVRANLLFRAGNSVYKS